MENRSILGDVLALAMLTSDSIPAIPRGMAKLSLFDWLVVGKAGSTEPVSRIISDFVLEEGGEPALLAHHPRAERAAHVRREPGHPLAIEFEVDTGAGIRGSAHTSIIAAPLGLASRTRRKR